MVPSAGNFGEIRTKLEKVSFRKMRLKMSVKGDPYSSGLRGLMQDIDNNIKKLSQVCYHKTH